VSSDTTSPSEEDHGSGLWLWHGKAPPPLPPLQPASRVEQIPGPNVSALRRRGWMALRAGLALALLAVILRSTPLDKPPPADTPAVALEPVPSPVEAHAAIPAPPVNISAPRIEQADTPFDQAQMPPAPATLGTEHELAKKAADHTSARTVRKTRAFAGSPFVIHGVLTPPEPTVSRDSGH